MFGTLIICLPSVHTGGDVVLQHQSQSMSFATDDDSAFGASYIAWWAYSPFLLAKLRLTPQQVCRRRARGTRASSVPQIK